MQDLRYDGIYDGSPSLFLFYCSILFYCSCSLLNRQESLKGFCCVWELHASQCDFEVISGRRETSSSIKGLQSVVSLHLRQRVCQTEFKHVLRRDEEFIGTMVRLELPDVGRGRPEGRFVPAPPGLTENCRTLGCPGVSSCQDRCGQVKSGIKLPTPNVSPVLLLSRLCISQLLM